MAADYRKFKTPFFEIEVGDPTGTRLVKLPHHILRLVQKVEIIETLVSEEFNTMSIEFIEGSREPASVDSRDGTKGLYKIDSDIAGSITNRPGSITDLRFSGTGGITFLTASESRTKVIDRRVQENVEGKKVTRAHIKEPSKPVFLFQQGNVVRITWGYTEDFNNRRSVMARIMVINTAFTSGGTRTTIQCTPIDSQFDQFTTTKGKPFGVKKPSGKGGTIVIFEDLKTDELIRKIADDLGIAKVVSTNLTADTVNSDKQKIWMAGESFKQFMDRLAESSGCYWKAIIDPKTKKDTIYFIKKSDFESRLIVKDTDLTTWMAPGSLLKEVRVNAEFNTASGNAQIGTTDQGEEQKVSEGTRAHSLFKSKNGQTEQIVDDNFVSGANRIPHLDKLKELSGEDITGTVDLNPSNSTQRIDGIAQSTTANDSRIITLEFTAIGFTGFTPGVVDIRNIGVRFSGKYRLLTVTHTIDSSGYTTIGRADNSTVSSGGLGTTDTPINKVEEQKEKEVDLFKSAATNTIMSEYDRAYGLKV